MFGYGSLMWQPGFAFVERAPALLHGYHRMLSVYSHYYRGTSERPGLVLGLEPGGSCRGIAYRVAGMDALATLAYLDAREIPHRVYRRRLVPIRVHAEGHGGKSATPRRVAAYTYVTVGDHVQYAGRLPMERCVELIVQGVGRTGTAHDYLENTVDHLEALGLRVPWLNRLRRAVRRRVNHG